jgi:hypothetical protein
MAGLAARWNFALLMPSREMLALASILFKFI